MKSTDDDIEATAPTSKLLMSSSTTTTTLASSNSVSNHTSSKENKDANSTKHDNLYLNTLGKSYIVDSNTASKSSRSDQQEVTNESDATTSLLTSNINNKIDMPEESSNYRSGSKVGSTESQPDVDITSSECVDRKESNIVVSLKLFAIFSTLYFFMWSSSILSQAFNLASYHYAGHFIRTSGFLQNPLIGLMVGIITTVVFQSSGAVTSVLVTIVGSGVLTVRQSIPIVMGANLGTSVTNTVVSLIVYRKKQNFEIAMTAGIVHDMYNMMSVVFMLPLELLLHPLEILSSLMLQLFGNDSRTEIGELQFLSYLVKPLVDIVIMIDKEKTANLDPNTIVPSNESLIRKCCNEERIGNTTKCHQECFSLFSHLDFSDNAVCILLLVIAMVTLFTCLIFVVKVTKSLLG